MSKVAICLSLAIISALSICKNPPAIKAQTKNSQLNQTFLEQWVKWKILIIWFDLSGSLLKVYRSGTFWLERLYFLLISATIQTSQWIQQHDPTAEGKERLNMKFSGLISSGWQSWMLVTNPDTLAGCLMSESCFHSIKNWMGPPQRTPNYISC